MTASIWDVTGTREFVMEGGTGKCENSVFISGPGGFCVEFDRGELLDHLKTEFFAIDQMDLAIYRILEAA